MTLTDDALTLLGNLGYDPTYGARPLRRVIQKQLTDRLALALLKGELREGDSVTVDAREGELVLDGAAAQDRAQPADMDHLSHTAMVATSVHERSTVTLRFQSDVSEPIS